MAIWSRLRKYKDMDLEKEERERFQEAESSDIPSMIFAAFIMLWLPAMAILCAMVFLLLWIFQVI